MSKKQRTPKFYGRAVPIDGPRATIPFEERDAYKADIATITGKRPGNMYKPTTEFIRNLYGHLKRTDYVPDDELAPRVEAFDRWLESVRREAWAEGWNAGVSDGSAYAGYVRGECPLFIRTENPYREETP